MNDRLRTAAACNDLRDELLQVRGLVQGVGFRPFVFRLAEELALDGWVRNDGGGVTIAVRGALAQLDHFAARLRSEAPPLARVERITRATADVQIERGFAIQNSEAGAIVTGITPDAAVCDACVAELLDPHDRRYRYPFINCTHCGPRFTITAGLPYDRPQTSMARFTQCADCQREYDAPRDRRFHAQPNACAVCGPRLWLTDARGTRLACDDVIAATVARLAAGEILAIKGLGGFHLVCDARNAAAVARLRARKHRDEKPFALMFANVASIALLADVSDTARATLQASARPIVLLPARQNLDEALPGIAPGLQRLGAMLPYTPLQVLLFHEAAGRPRAAQWHTLPQPLVLVMTSANPGGEPLVIDNHEAVARLGGIADAFVMHDRDILVRCDDSVMIAEANDLTPRFIRRARGYTPAPIGLPRCGPAVLALGSYLKNTACLTRGDQAFLAQHIGDLDNAASCAALEEAVAHLQRVLALRPQAIAHDLHPDIFSTRLALQLAAEWQVPALGVQHHHAHIAAVAAEHGVDEPLLGIALDGVGLSEAGEAWGGELLQVDGLQCERLGHLRPLPLAGGDRAAREPWRMAAAALHLLGRGEQIATRFADQTAAPAVAQMLAQGLRTPLTTSAGRWFDAAAGLLGVRAVMAYEGQAAMQLEALAQQHGDVAPQPLYAINDGVLDLLPLAERLADERNAGYGAALFHATLAAALADLTAAAAQRSGRNIVALGGGCFLNAVLTRQLSQHLQQRGHRVLLATQAPPNDGGIALGQAWIALQSLA